MVSELRRFVAQTREFASPFQPCSVENTPATLSFSRKHMIRAAPDFPSLFLIRLASKQAGTVVYGGASCLRLYAQSSGAPRPHCPLAIEKGPLYLYATLHVP